MKRYKNSFFDAFFNSYASDSRMRLAVLLNEIAYNQEALVAQLLTGEPDTSLDEDETLQLRRAVTILEEKLSRENLRIMPRWFWEDRRFYANPKEPDFVVDDNSAYLKQRLMDKMFDEASNNFLQRSTFFHKHSLEIV